MTICFGLLIIVRYSIAADYGYGTVEGCVRLMVVVEISNWLCSVLY